MLRDIYDMTECHSTVTIRIFRGIMDFEDVILTRDNIDHYNKVFEISCIVPKYNNLMIEGTIG